MTLKNDADNLFDSRDLPGVTPILSGRMFFTNGELPGAVLSSVAFFQFGPLRKYFHKYTPRDRETSSFW
jgi:hypothetical protein